MKKVFNFFAVLLMMAFCFLSVLGQKPTATPVVIQPLPDGATIVKDGAFVVTEGASVVTDGASVVTDGATSVIAVSKPTLVVTNETGVSISSGLLTELGDETKVEITYTRDRNNKWVLAPEFRDNEYGSIASGKHLVSILSDNFVISGFRVRLDRGYDGAKDIVFAKNFCLTYDKVYTVVITNHNFLKPLRFNFMLGVGGRLLLS